MGNTKGWILLVATLVLVSTGSQASAQDWTFPGNMCQRSGSTQDNVSYAQYGSVNNTTAVMRLQCPIVVDHALGTGAICVDVRVGDGNDNVSNSQVKCRVQRFDENGTLWSSDATTGTTTTGTTTLNLSMSIDSDDGLTLECDLPGFDAGYSAVWFYRVYPCLI